MKAGIVIFPGINRERDMAIALRGSGAEPRMVWHKETDLSGLDLIVIPGGFSHGDYLRCGAMAAHSPVMSAVRVHAERGGYVLGVCNGFQILTEAGLLPGALVRNRDLQFHCEQVFLKTQNFETSFTNKIPRDKILKVPIAHGEGCYFADDATLATLKANNQILWQYCDAEGNLTDKANPNGSLLNIAGLCNERGNVAGLMPHPERASESALGNDDGKWIFESVIATLERKRVAKAA